MTRTGRGRCRYCGRYFALTKDGKVRRHNTLRGALCGGSGNIPA